MKILNIIVLISTLIFANGFKLESKDIKKFLTKEELFNGFGCNGNNHSPELHWSGAPKGTKSFAITLHDPDAPKKGGWWHWIVINIPANVNEIKNNASAKNLLPKGAIEIVNDFGFTHYGGACPPKGDKAHRYIFTIYALDTPKLNIKSIKNRDLAISLIKKHTIAKASIMAYYQRK